MEYRPVKCMECGITWSSHHDFLNHFAAIERHTHPLIKCSRCGKEITAADNYTEVTALGDLPERVFMHTNNCVTKEAK